MNETIVVATTKLFQLRDDMETVGMYDRPLTNQEMKFVKIMNEMEQALKKPDSSANGSSHEVTQYEFL
ncbi:hypothetical protein [Enterococcus sp. BWR-S5]|uniref:hypothetical protein n=1 Tax=Enterococcus sp. BWR-S5 TaxID=2787714 RepID=UPI0019246A29|nr:hypothetical protein [Enterococcus sp. BWR-S5]MBL1225405.1 hypothetical protein [Enterococcus sp. BWR-S5]